MPHAFERLGMAVLAKMAAEPGNDMSKAPNNDTSKGPNVPVPDPKEDQRKQDLHEQQLRFNEDKHEVELAKLQLQVQQAQEVHQGKQQQQQEQQQSQQQDQQAEQQQQQAQQDDMMQQQQAQQSQQYQQNIMAKAAAMYTDEIEPLNMSSPIPAAATGAGLGGIAAHVMAPTEAARHYRALASEITPEQVKDSIAAAKKHGKKLPKEFMEQVRDMSPKGDKVRFSAPAHIRKRFFQNRALQANAKRLVLGSGLGLLTGLASHQAMKD